MSLLSGRDFETREYREDIVEDSYNKLYDGVKAFVSQTNFERYVMILKSAGIIDDSLIRSQNVLNFGYILFLLLRERNVNPDIIEKLVKRWVIMSIITQRYTSSPESQFDLDIRRLNEAEDLINIGAYKRGSNPEIDYAIEKIGKVNGFLLQDVDEKFTFEQSVEMLQNLFEG